MTLKEYFQDIKGIGVLSTADADGKVNVAIYARPHFLGDDEDEVAFVMNDRLSHSNVGSNPSAAYLFIEKAEGYSWKRLYLTKTREETDQDKIQSIRRRNLSPECDKGAGSRFLVYFHVDEVLPLVR